VVRPVNQGEEAIIYAKKKVLVRHPANPIVKLPRGVTIDGNDLLGQPGHEYVVGLCGDQVGVVQGDWKYLFTTSGGGELLFNLADDPYEQKNLIRTATEQRRQLRAHAWPGWHTRIEENDVLH
jgi:hypothetical protein